MKVKEFALHMLIIPLGITLAFLLVAFLVKAAMNKYPEFDRWAREVWPNRKQKEMIVLFAIIAFFIWVSTNG
jgi:hypothetical protein